MDPRFSVVAILLLFDITSYCFANENGSLKMDNTSNETSHLILETLQVGSIPATSGLRKTISELKCEEYIKEIANIPEALIVFLDDNRKPAIPFNLYNLCKILKLRISGSLRHNNGTEAYRGEYPHMVALGKYDSDGIFMAECGGTLISHTWVLSAAHCTHGPNGTPTHARMGITRLTDLRSNITIAIKNIVRHPDYNPPAMYGDIALIELETSVRFSLTIYPACLYWQYDLPLYKKEAVITNWDVSDKDGEQCDYLQKAFVPLIDNSKCKVKHNTSKEIPCGIKTSMICAGGDVNEDTCHKDSGGPLQIKEHFCIHHIIGITSFGRDCGFMHPYGVYTKVSYYISWIENIVWPQQNTHELHTESPEILPSLLDIVTGTNGSQRTISELKCGEYAEEIADITEKVKIYQDDICESRTLTNFCKVLKVYGHFGGGAIGGTNAYRGEYPHMVALGKYNTDGVFVLICGGTLISHTWILTAAHCTYGPNGAPTDARMGINRLTDQNYGITISIKNMMRHPDYNPPALYADIALMELSSPVKFSRTMYPACLYQQFDLPLYRMYATITGWGTTEIDGEQSDYLQQVHLPVVDNLKCRAHHNTSKEIPLGITSSMICAGGEVDKDACHGDSGGPLQIYENPCMPHIIGITSFGRSCGVINSSGVYTRVSFYISWIENVVWPQKK